MEKLFCCLSIMIGKSLKKTWKLTWESATSPAFLIGLLRMSFHKFCHMQSCACFYNLFATGKRKINSPPSVKLKLNCLYCDLQEFDSSCGPAWHCIVGTSFGSYVTHSLGGFLYFSIDKVYILLFKTAVEPMEHWMMVFIYKILNWLL